MSTNDGDLVLVGLGRLSNDGRNESGSSDDIKVSDTEQPSSQLCDQWRACSSSSLLGVKDTSLLEGLGEDWDRRVDGVGDDEDESLGASVGNGLSEGGTDTSVDLGLVRSGFIVFGLTF